MEEETDLRTKVEVARYFGVTSSAIEEWCMKTGIAFVPPKNRVDMAEMCNFVSQMPINPRSDRIKQGNIRGRAREYLKERGIPQTPVVFMKKVDYPRKPKIEKVMSKLNKTEVKAELVEVERSIKKTSKPGNKDLGIKSAVERLRLAEYDTHALFRKAFDSGDTAVIGYSLKVYQDVMDLLRKSENDLLKVLKDQEVVIEYDVVKKWILNEVDKVKKAILTIPSKLATQLENKPHYEIQEILYNECEDICNMFSSDIGKK